MPASIDPPARRGQTVANVVSEYPFSDFSSVTKKRSVFLCGCSRVISPKAVRIAAHGVCQVARLLLENIEQLSQFGEDCRMRPQFGHGRVEARHSSLLPHNVK